MSRMSSGPAVHQETEMVRQIDRNAEPPSSPEGRVRRGPVDLSVALAGVTLRSPIVSASGCFGSGREISEFYDLRQLGAVTVKSMTLDPWQGKPTPRMVETARLPSLKTATSLGHHDVGMRPAGSTFGGVVVVSTFHAPMALIAASVAYRRFALGS